MLHSLLDFLPILRHNLVGLVRVIDFSLLLVIFWLELLVVLLILLFFYFFSVAFASLGCTQCFGWLLVLYDFNLFAKQSVYN